MPPERLAALWYAKSTELGWDPSVEWHGPAVDLVLRAIAQNGAPTVPAARAFGRHRADSGARFDEIDVDIQALTIALSTLGTPVEDPQALLSAARMGAELAIARTTLVARVRDPLTGMHTPPVLLFAMWQARASGRSTHLWGVRWSPRNRRPPAVADHLAIGTGLVPELTPEEVASLLGSATVGVLLSEPERAGALAEKLVPLGLPGLAHEILDVPDCGSVDDLAEWLVERFPGVAELVPS